MWIGGVGVALIVGGLVYWSSNQPLKAAANTSNNPNPWLAFAENGANAMAVADENLYRRHRRSKAMNVMLLGGLGTLAGAGMWYSSRRRVEDVSTFSTKGQSPTEGS